jgi:hypothetical protein
VTVALLANAFVCGALSGPHDRYGARIVWIATLNAAITVLQAIESFAATLEESSRERRSVTRLQGIVSGRPFVHGASARFSSASSGKMIKDAGI